MLFAQTLQNAGKQMLLQKHTANAKVSQSNQMGYSSMCVTWSQPHRAYCSVTGDKTEGRETHKQGGPAVAEWRPGRTLKGANEAFSEAHNF